MNDILQIIFQYFSLGINRMVVGFTSTYAISAYHHKCCEFESHSWQDALDTTLCDQVCQWLATGRWFSPGTSVSSTNITDRQDITEILLKVALNTINSNPIFVDNKKWKLFNELSKGIQEDQKVWQ